MIHTQSAHFRLRTARIGELPTIGALLCEVGKIACLLFADLTGLAARGADAIGGGVPSTQIDFTYIWTNPFNPPDLPLFGFTCGR